MKARGFLLATLFLSGVHALAASLSESFDSRADFAGGTAVWNQALGKIHPTLRAMNFETPFTPFDFSVGDGSDGVFNNTTYANFSVAGNVSGQIIRLDTNAHPTLQVTSFTLDQGWQIIPAGTNPLIIESLSTVKILGEIHCEGEAGGASAGAIAGTGGPGHCGGANGGDGGIATLQGNAGGDISAGVVTGGSGGAASGANGGGGGGSWSQSSPPTNGPGGGGGLAGLFHANPEFTTLLGSAGGGGGSGDATTAGGGGGGGGGVVIIRAVGDVDLGATPASAFGFIYAGGGKGGNASGNGGPGGGGGGGSIQIFSGGLVNLFNTDPGGASQAPAGATGTNAGAATGSKGGLGRSWVSTSTFFTSGSGTYTPIEEFPVNSGNIEFNSATQNVVTRVFDTADNYTIVNTLSFAPLSNDFLFEVAGSSDAFASDDTGWTSTPALVADKRYLKMRLSITTSNVANPDMIDTAIIDYTLGSQDSFAFKSAGCGRVSGSASPYNLLLLLIAPLLLLGLKIETKRQLARERARTRR